jgi:hypothetical protein
VLCCIRTARDDDGSEEDVSVSHTHDSPLVMTREGGGGGSPTHSPPGSSFQSTPKFRASTPPPFQNMRGDSSGGGVMDSGGGGFGNNTARDDESRRRQNKTNASDPWATSASDVGSPSASDDGDESNDDEYDKHDGDEKRKLLCGDALSSDGSVRTQGSKTKTKKPPVVRRKSLGDGGTSKSGTGADQNKLASKHHRVKSEPASGGASSPRYEPPIDVDQVRPDGGGVSAPLEGGTATSVDALGVSVAASTTGQQFFADHLRRALSSGKLSILDKLDKLDKSDRSGHARADSGASTFSTLADDLCCPTCFEGYCSENPKMPLACGHHFHLGCIYEWYERSNLCPVCEVPMEFHASTGWSLAGDA